MVKHLTIACGLLVLLSACGDETSTTAPTDDDDATIAQRDVRPQGQNDVVEDVEAELDVASNDVEDAAQELDLLIEPEITDVAEEPIEDLAEETASDVPFEIPEATDDCEPLGISEQWIGTFDGEITSNIPPMGGYRFDGPVSGDVSFEIRCVDSKLMVFGNLDGEAEECAISCPFTARMEGVYDPDTLNISGELLDGVIDFTAVQIYAEGVFDGVLSEDSIFNGTWSGDKVGISSIVLEWTEAHGEGTWQAEPAGL